ncbi:hypothetical protein M405DRAFT_332239 [Rhizopogon salebrosus TDB-379]|nr:hypothetical protein M405DRAFT_332239 [Rhizopogon salebrosus TDB-379]
MIATRLELWEGRSTPSQLDSKHHTFLMLILQEVYLLRRVRLNRNRILGHPVNVDLNVPLSIN